MYGWFTRTWDYSDTILTNLELMFLGVHLKKKVLFKESCKSKEKQEGGKSKL